MYQNESNLSIYLLSLHLDFLQPQKSKPAILTRDASPGKKKQQQQKKTIVLFKLRLIVSRWGQFKGYIFDFFLTKTWNHLSRNTEKKCETSELSASREFIILCFWIKYNISYFFSRPCQLSMMEIIWDNS